MHKLASRLQTIHTDDKHLASFSEQNILVNSFPGVLFYAFKGDMLPCLPILAASLSVSVY